MRFNEIFSSNVVFDKSIPELGIEVGDTLSTGFIRLMEYIGEFQSFNLLDVNTKRVDLPAIELDSKKISSIISSKSGVLQIDSSEALSKIPDNQDLKSIEHVVFDKDGFIIAESTKLSTGFDVSKDKYPLTIESKLVTAFEDKEVVSFTKKQVFFDQKDLISGFSSIKASKLAGVGESPEDIIVNLSQRLQDLENKTS